MFAHLLVPQSVSAHSALPSSSSMSYHRVLSSLLSLLEDVYTALAGLPLTPPALALLAAVDRRLQSTVLQPLIVDLTAVATALLKVDITGLKALLQQPPAQEDAAAATAATAADANSAAASYRAVADGATEADAHAPSPPPPHTTSADVRTE